MTANVSRNGANAIIVEGTPEARTNRALIANLIGAARLPAIHTEPLGKRACRGSISPSRHGRKIRSAASTWHTTPREVRGVGRLSKYTISFDSYRLNIRDTVALRERQTTARRLDEAKPAFSNNPITDDWTYAGLRTERRPHRNVSWGGTHGHTNDRGCIIVTLSSR